MRVTRSPHPLGVVSYSLGQIDVMAWRRVATGEVQYRLWQSRHTALVQRSAGLDVSLMQIGHFINCPSLRVNGLRFV